MAAGTIVLDGSGNGASTRAALLDVPGIGPWTADYVAMRALGDADAFPVGDLGLRRALGPEVTARELAAASEAWRPFRAYAAVHLWASKARRDET